MSFKVEYEQLISSIDSLVTKDTEDVTKLFEKLLKRLYFIINKYTYEEVDCYVNKVKYVDKQVVKERKLKTYVPGKEKPPTSPDYYGTGDSGAYI